MHESISTANQGLAALWTYFADRECGGYSPLYRSISTAVAADNDVLDLVRSAPPSGHYPTMLLGAVHYLLLDGLEHPLAAIYAGESDADVGALFADVCLTQRDAILHLLATRHTNTNEVGRAAVIGPALTEVAGRMGTPLALVDVGCSAGLNLLCDRYRLDYGAHGATGPEDAAVRIDCEVVSGRPPIARALPPLAVRVGIDRDPIDIGDADEVRWLLACVWPDTGRLARTRLALAEARRIPRDLVQGDAVDTVAEVLLALPADAVPVVITTWMLAYLPADRRAAFREALAAVSTERPIAWFSAEGPGVVDLFADHVPPTDALGMDASVMGLVTFRDGVPEPRLLGFVQPHGRWVEWLA